MNKDLPIHPTIFLFMTHLRCYVYQQGISNIALNHAGVHKAPKNTIMALKLANRAREVEEKYLQGTITPTEVLQHVAGHYADSALQDALSKDSQSFIRRTYDPSNDDEEITQSQDAALVDPEMEDERRTALQDDKGITDMGTDDWEIAHWRSPGISS